MVKVVSFSVRLMIFYHLAVFHHKSPASQTDEIIVEVRIDSSIRTKNPPKQTNKQRNKHTNILLKCPMRLLFYWLFGVVCRFGSLSAM